ncbi:hypothetical protein EYZ11_003580 [Aspergillus tanneri]|uniref:Uncharacterized protein n=1 Tax=Aspergillus tanneri TaxID=1220188 RepID=A0A4S3JMQ0_9EURO|nr:hypothetical protein EYZ11_003580 [Aspergillus tanneri]
MCSLQTVHRQNKVFDATHKKVKNVVKIS